MSGKKEISSACTLHISVWYVSWSALPAGCDRRLHCDGYERLAASGVSAAVAVVEILKDSGLKLLAPMSGALQPATIARPRPLQLRLP